MCVGTESFSTYIPAHHYTPAYLPRGALADSLEYIEDQLRLKTIMEGALGGREGGDGVRAREGGDGVRAREGGDGVRARDGGDGVRARLRSGLRAAALSWDFASACRFYMFFLKECLDVKKSVCNKGENRRNLNEPSGLQRMSEVSLSLD